MADDIYACVYGNDIFKQTDGEGEFVGLGFWSDNWEGIAIAPNGDLYVIRYYTGGAV